MVTGWPVLTEAAVTQTVVGPALSSPLGLFQSSSRLHFIFTVQCFIMLTTRACSPVTCSRVLVFFFSLVCSSGNRAFFDLLVLL